MRNSSGMISAIFVSSVMISLVMGGCSGNGQRDGVSKKKRTELTVIYGSDLLGSIRSCGCTQEDTGGLSRRATFIKQVRKGAKNLLVLDAGDAFSLDLSYSKKEAELTFEAFDIMGLDVLTPGEIDFIFGIEYLQSLAANSSFDIVAANLVDAATGQPFFGSSFVTRVLDGGIKVAITGVIDESVRFPGYIDSSGFRIESSQKTLEKVIPQMKREADFLILLSHMGVDRTSATVEAVPGFDLAVVGHGKPVIKREVKIGKTLILGTGGMGQYVGRINLILDPGGGYSQGTIGMVQLTSKDFESDRNVDELFLLYGLPLTDKELEKKMEGVGK